MASSAINCCSGLTDGIEQRAADRSQLTAEGGDGSPEIGFVEGHRKFGHLLGAGRSGNGWDGTGLRRSDPLLSGSGAMGVSQAASGG